MASAASDDAKETDLLQPTFDEDALGNFILDRGRSDPGVAFRAWRRPRSFRSYRSRPLRTLLLLLLGAAGVAILAVLIVVPLGWREQAVAGGALIAAALALSWVSRSAPVTLALMIVSLFSTLRYGYWRTTETWSGLTSAGHLHEWDTVFVLLLLAAEYYAFLTLALGYFQTLRPLRRPPVPLEGPPSDWPRVDVLIPTYNEPLDVVRGTVLGALALDYPADRFKVFLLDDGRRDEFREFAAQVGVTYVTRTSNAHAKAGNINQALTRLTGEHVAIFDSDHVPTRSFLKSTLGWFIRDPRMGLVQTPHHFYSPDPFERNLGQFRRVPNEGALFHRLVQDGNDLWNASFFCGSCAVLRRSALDEIGGIAVETVTEDAHTALRMQRRGWNTAYINLPQAAGLATESLSAHIGQRVRWARGMVQILRIENPLFGRGLSLAQRLCYFNATTHYLFALPRLIFLTIPLTYLLLGMVNIHGYSLAVFAYALPHVFIAHVTNGRVQNRVRSPFWNEIYEAVLAPYILLPTLLALINPRLGKFNVTAKGGIVQRTYFDHRVALPLLLLLGLNVAGLVMAGRRYVIDPAHHDTVIMNAVWTLYNVIVLSVAASVALERRQRRADVRVDLRMPAAIVTADGSRFEGIAAQLSQRGAAVHFPGLVPIRLETRVTVVLGSGKASCAIPAEIVDAGRRKAHLVFPRLRLEQERFLVHVMYSRPDAWLNWDAGRRIDTALSSLWRIIWLSLRGFFVVIAGVFNWRRPPSEVPKPRRRPGSRAAATASTIFVALTMAQPASAQDSATVSNAAMFHDAYALAEIAGQRATALRGEGALLNFYFGVPVTKIISRATLALRYRAPLVAQNELRLELLLNGTRVGATTIVGGNDVEAEIPLPTDLLTTDNTMSLRVEGQCAACSRSSAPWIAIDSASRLETSGTRLPLANDLALLPIPFFDAVSQRAWQLPVVFSQPPALQEVNAAAIVASWFGVFSDIRGVRFPVSVGELPEGHALVLLRRGSMLDSALLLPTQPRTLIAMRDNPRDPYGKLLILAGDSPADLVAAARALVAPDRMPAHAGVEAVRDPGVQGRWQYDAPRWLRVDRPAPIGLYTSAERLKLIGSGSIDIYFRLPPDLFLAAQQSVPLQLRFEYAGVAMDAPAALHVRLNGQDVDTVRLNPNNTPVKTATLIRLPTGRLRPYTNTMTIDVDFGRHGSTESGARYVVINRESTIDLRGLPHSVVLPRLELVVDSGYPFTQWADLSGTAVVLSNAPTPGEYQSLLNMVGFFGAQTGAPVTGLTVTTPENVRSAQDRDLVVLGSPASQPLLAVWASRMPATMSSGTLAVNPAPTPSRWLYPHWPFRDNDRQRLARALTGDPRPDAIVEHFVSPFRPDRSVVAIVPGDADTWQTAESLFVQRRGPVYGGVAIAREGRFESFLLGVTAYHAGSVNRYQRLHVYLVEYYSLIPVAVLLVALVIGGGLHTGAERVAQRRLEHL